jgi:hypothetical protein
VAWCFPLGLTTWVLPNSNVLVVFLLPERVKKKITKGHTILTNTNHKQERQQRLTRTYSRGIVAHYIPQKKNT